MIGIFDDAVDWTDRHTFWFSEVPNAFRAVLVTNLINRAALKNSVIRTRWLAYIAINTFIGNE